jgi:histidinol-phosphate phosphatase family protein
MKKKTVKKPAVFLDRDGTLMVNIDYISDPAQVRVFTATADALKRLKRAGFYLIVVTNQSGAARGYFPVSAITKVNRRLQQKLRAQGTRIDGFFYCPHHPKGTVKSLTKKCDCRKPGTGMVKQALKRFPIDLSRSYVVGDNLGDVELAKNAGLAAGLLVKTGHGRHNIADVKKLKIKNSHVVAGIAQAARWILKDVKQKYVVTLMNADKRR